MLRLLTTFFCLLIAVCALQAQDLPLMKAPTAGRSFQKGGLVPSPHFADRPIKATLYGVDDGLSQGLVYSMALDHYGRLWIATKDGLNCYNGLTFRTYRHEPGNARSMAHDQVKSMATDTLGRLWLVYANGALGILDPVTESFGRPLLSAAYNAHFVGVYCLPDGRMLLHSTDSIQHYALQIAEVVPGPAPETTLRLLPIEADFPGLSSILNIKTADFISVHSCANGILWLSTIDSLYRHAPLPNGGGTAWTGFAMSQNKKSQNQRYINFIADPEGDQAFVVDSNLVMHQYNEARNTFEPLLRLPADTTLGGGCFMDRRKRVYLFDSNDNLLRINILDGACERLLPEWNRGFLSLNLQLRFALEDAHGNVWIGTPGTGVVQLNHNNDRFTTFMPPFSTYEAGIYNYRTEQPGRIRYYDPAFSAAWQAYRKRYHPDRFFTGNVMRDAQGDYWAILIGGLSFGLVRMDAGKGSIAFVQRADFNQHFLGRRFFAGRDGRLWLNTCWPNASPGFWSYNPATGETKDYAIPALPADDDYPAISDWHETPRGHWWIASTAGLFFLNPETEAWKQFRHTASDSTSLSADVLLSICPDPAEPQRYLWVGTEGGGLNRFDLHDSTFRPYTTAHGLPNNVVYGILPDSHGNLWLSTNQGISHFHVKENIFVNYNAASGLAGNEFNRYEYAVCKDGNLYFGGTAGLTIIDPERFYESTPPSTTIITGLKVQNVPVHFQPGSASLLESPIHASSHLELPYDHRMFAFEFANLDLSSPEVNEFKYMLEGFDKEWIDAGTSNEATYTNLNPGDYIFKVLGRNSFKVWNESPTTLRITILAPWWATWWFRTLAVLVTAAVLYGLYRYRLNSLLGMERLRNRIAQDLHDEIGSTLSSISLYSAVMQKSSEGLPQKSHDILGKIIDSTSEIMEKMSDMVWTIKSDNDDLGQVINRMRAFAANVTDSQNIHLYFRADPKVETLKLDMDKRKNIYLIYKEAVINAIKYSGCSELHISLRKTRQELELIVRDNGCGFDPHTANTTAARMGGNGISGMHTRAASLGATLHIDTAVGQGTTMRLSIGQNH